MLASLLLILAAAEGPWLANGARLELSDQGGKIVGKLAAEGGPCPVPKGTELLKGTLLDDSLSAQVRLCLISEKCGADPATALAVLLVTKSLTEGAGLLREGRFEQARALFESAVQKDPQRAEAYNGVGVTFYARADLDEALAWYKRSLEADPRFGDAFYNMACVYALQQQPELAFRYLRLAALNHYSEREATEKDPDLTSLHGDPRWREILEQFR